MKGRIYIELINGPFLFRDRGIAGRIRRRPEAASRAEAAFDARQRNVRNAAR